MLDKSEQELVDLNLSPDIAYDTQHETWYLAITRFAKQLRQVGHVESAHFMDVAALILKENRRH
ncbi:MAG: hypothetical protein HOA08_01945 [Rhodospirillaceae bacterium]|jgi:hypothetical protein|nr:hypothetical protein [Rhodospirillaceae bacterium]MBT3491793.1 hypothetical protein [Rhodospirillaceae bacterium]MBT3783151.1 hypothetical protein [Rhodospirillaceae bacterium]MBT3978147.1 hypothetical protein [Rhodospirillaceae bacterium]MBT4171062.1 hypothetical protein [Rhodospirillaceae bacterium]